jgi:hypothetical protein
VDSRSDIISTTLICPCLPGSDVAQIVVLLSKKAVLESERVIKEENTRAQQPIVFVSSPNGDPAIDAAVNIFAHELAETATDPLLNAWWADSDSDENADKCSFNFGEGFLSWTKAVSKRSNLTLEVSKNPSVSTSDSTPRISSCRGCLWSFMLSSKASLRLRMRSAFCTAYFGGHVSGYMAFGVLAVRACTRGLHCRKIRGVKHQQG